RAQTIQLLLRGLGALRQTTLLHEALIVLLGLHAGTLQHHLFVSAGTMCCEQTHRQQQACQHLCRSEATLRVLQTATRPSQRAPARCRIGSSQGVPHHTQSGGSFLLARLAKSRLPHIRIGVWTCALRCHYTQGKSSTTVVLARDTKV